MNQEQEPVRLAITLGDPNGIGPEVARKAMQHYATERNVAFTVFGETPTAYPTPICKEAGAFSAQAVKDAIAAALEGKVEGIVTAPICKASWELAGEPYPGHTEMLAELAGTEDVAMMLAGKGLRVVLVTRHLPIHQVAEAIDEKLILRAIRHMHQGLLALGVPRQRIAVCGLNPHAGDGGTIGTEEQTCIIPALAKARLAGYDAIGPLSADTVFYYALRGEYDGVVAMYHDQGLAPLKMHAFDDGVNITLGLPFVRTSPDHGTAFDIAGKGIAKPNSMVAAIETAIQLCWQRRKEAQR